MSRFGFTSTAEEVTADLDLSGKTYLVTGITSGLGLETARVLSLRGARVLGTGRTRERAEAALADFPEAYPMACDLNDIDSVRSCAAGVRSIGAPLDGIIANAGVMAIPEWRGVRGFEMQFFTNHIGHSALVLGLLDRLAPAGRVVMLSSGAHRMAPPAGIDFDNLRGEGDYAPWPAYGRSKLANLLFAKGLAKRLDGGRTAHSLHPGVIETELQRHMPNWESAKQRMKLKNIGQGAATQVLVATRPEVTESVPYWSDCQPKKPGHDKAFDDALVETLWGWTEETLAAL